MKIRFPPGARIKTLEEIHAMLNPATKPTLSLEERAQEAALQMPYLPMTSRDELRELLRRAGRFRLYHDTVAMQVTISEQRLALATGTNTPGALAQLIVLSVRELPSLLDRLDALEAAGRKAVEEFYDQGYAAYPGEGISALEAALKEE